jgi:hypothetical protein
MDASRGGQSWTVVAVAVAVAVAVEVAAPTPRLALGVAYGVPRSPTPVARQSPPGDLSPTLESRHPCRSFRAKGQVGANKVIAYLSFQGRENLFGTRALQVSMHDWQIVSLGLPSRSGLSVPHMMHSALSGLARAVCDARAARTRQSSQIAPRTPAITCRFGREAPQNAQEWSVMLHPCRVQ